jgi:hypothetical protein
MTSDDADTRTIWAGDAAFLSRHRQRPAAGSVAWHRIGRRVVPVPGGDPEVLAGFVERVTFHNEENGFCVLRVKARGQRDLITVLGHAAMISAGEFVQASGTWVNDRTHGVQFRASFLKATQPTTAEGIKKYLGFGMIRGIVRAARLPLPTMLNGRIMGLTFHRSGECRLSNLHGGAGKAMYSIRDLSRREILIMSAVLAESSGVVFSPKLAAAEAALQRTPDQILGPFYPLSELPQTSDLTRVSGRKRR